VLMVPLVFEDDLMSALVIVYLFSAFHGIADYQAGCYDGWCLGVCPILVGSWSLFISNYC